MNEIGSIIDLIQAGGFVGLLIILAFPKLRKQFGFGNGNITKEELKDALTYDKPDRPALIQRIPFICSDIEDINEKLSNLEQDVSFIRGKLSK